MIYGVPTPQVFPNDCDSASISMKNVDITNLKDDKNMAKTKYQNVKLISRS